MSRVTFHICDVCDTRDKVDSPETPQHDIKDVIVTLKFGENAIVQTFKKMLCKDCAAKLQGVVIRSLQAPAAASETARG